MNYGKIIKGNLKVCSYIPNVSNPSDKALKKYAIDNGYKEIEYVDAPHQYATSSWNESEDKITQVWTEESVDSVKQQLLDQVQQELNSKVEQRTSVTTSLGFDVVYDTQAQMNVMGLIAFGQGGSLIDANDVEHQLSNEDLQKVAIALSTYKTGLYTEAQEKRQKINNCTTIEELIDL